MGILSLVAAFLGVMIMTLFHFEKGTPTWRLYEILRSQYKVQAGLGGIAVALVLLFWVAIKFCGGGAYAYLLWQWTALASTFFPVTVVGIFKVSQEEMVLVSDASIELIAK